MKQEATFVECHFCILWKEEYRRNNVCRRCNNTKKVVDPKEVLCNMCGGPMSPIGTEREQYPYGLYKVCVEGGYDSYHLHDMVRYSFSFCEKCLREMFMRCKIKPDVANIDYITDGDDDEEMNGCFEKDQQSYEYKLWYDAGGAHQAYLERKCNSAKECPNQAVYTVKINGSFSEDCCCEEHKRYEGGSIELVPFISNVLKPFL